MEQPVFSVSDFIAFINQTLEYAYPSVAVEGEVASFKISKDTYVFFDLKDQGGAVNCFMMAYQLRHPLEDGMRVRVIAQPRVTAWGKFSLTVRTIVPVGEGSIKRSFDMLRTKLQAEGLFDEARKRRLPAMPQHIGMVASVESAGYADFIKVLAGRWGGMDIEVADVRVQGVSAANQIMAAIGHFNQLHILPEALVIVRGGGSAEDLAVFNDEALVRAIAASRVPTLVGVGHEVDTSLADLVADVRAATPSNAAQLLVPDRQAMMRELTQREHRLCERLTAHIATVRQDIEGSRRTMLSRLDAAAADYAAQLRASARMLAQLDPALVLRRGYALVRSAKGIINDHTNPVKAGDLLTITMARVILKAEVTYVERPK